MHSKKILLIYEKSYKSGFGHYNRIINLNSKLKKKYYTKIIDIKKINKKNLKRV